MDAITPSAKDNGMHDPSTQIETILTSHTNTISIKHPPCHHHEKLPSLKPPYPPTTNSQTNPHLPLSPSFTAHHPKSPVSSPAQILPPKKQQQLNKTTPSIPPFPFPPSLQTFSLFTPSIQTPSRSLISGNSVSTRMPIVRVSSPLARARRTKDVMVGVQPVGCGGVGGGCGVRVCWVCWV